jgi:hypothetical protein
MIKLGYERVLRVLVAVDEDWLTDDGREPIDSGWIELDESVRKYLRYFDGYGSGPTMSFIEWEGKAEIV